MSRLFLFLAVFVFGLSSCRQSSEPLAPVTENKETIGQSSEWTPPDILFGELFRRVQMEQVFPDGKTFVDCVPKFPAAEIMDNYEAAKDQAEFHLKAFVIQHFDLPAEPGKGFSSDANRSIAEHINALWPVLTREAGAGEGDEGSLIPLPNDYIVPGGRFREIYYWDSYFTMLGLKADDRPQDIRNMVDNFAYLIEKVGFIPNGNRTYYLTRSQPPFFAAMVSLLAEIDGDSTLLRYLPALEREYEWWMDGKEQLDENTPAALHTVRLADGAILNRYYDRGDRPRAESYREDVETIHESGRDSTTVARHLRSGAESGWDYSSRWLADNVNLSSIETTDIIPPDLNALLYHHEEVLERAYTEAGREEEAAGMRQQMVARREAMRQHLWNPSTNWFEDYHWPSASHTGRLSLAGMYPFFFGTATTDQATVAFPVLESRFLADGGLRSTLVETGQQWDAPNGWPPLQYLSIEGLRRYGNAALADTISNRWMANNERVYENVGKMVEKYNVEDLSLEAGGGEYPVQDGFGWSNGVYLALRLK